MRTGTEQPDSRKLRPRGRRRRITGLVILILIIIGTGVRVRLDDWVRTLTEERVRTALGGSCRIGWLRVSLWNLGVEFRDAELEIADRGVDTLRVRVERGELRLGWFDLARLRKGRLRLRELRLDGPVLDSTGKLPPGKRREPRAEPMEIDLRIDDLRVAAGRWIHQDHETPLDLELRDLDLGAALSSDRRAVLGRARMEIAVQRLPLARSLPLSLHTEFRWRAGRLEIVDLEAEGGGLEIDLDAELEWAEGMVLDGRGRVRADLDLLETFLIQKFPRVAGAAEGAFLISAGPGPFRLGGEFEGQELGYGRLNARRAYARAVYSRGRIELSELHAEAFGGDVEGAVEVRLGRPAAFHVDVHGEQLASTELLSWLKLRLPLSSRMSAEVTLDGVTGDVGSWHGGGAFRAEPEPGGAGLVAVGGSGTVTLDQGQLSLAGREMQVGSAGLDVAFDARLGVKPLEGRLEISGETWDARETQLAAFDVLDSLGISLPNMIREPLHGSGRVGATVSFGGGPALELMVDLGAGAWSGEPFDRAAVELELAAGELTVHRADISHRDQRLSGSIRIGIDPFDVRNVTLDAEEMDCRRVLPLLGLDIGFSGQVSGYLRIDERESGLWGSGRLGLHDGQWHGESIDEASANLKIEADRVRLSEVALAGPAFEARGGATWNLETREAEIRLEGGAVDLAATTAVLERDLPLGGRVGLAGTVRFAPQGVSGTVNMDADELAYAGRSVGSASGEITIDDEAARLRLRATTEAEWEATARLGWSPELPLEVELRLDQTFLDLVELRETPIWSVVSGTVSLRGPLARPREIEMDGALERALLVIGPRRFEVADPLRFGVHDARLRVGPLHLVAPDTDLTASIEIGLEDRRLDLSCVGEVDLGLTSAIAPELRAAGRVALDVSARGALDRPTWNGSVRIERGRLRWLGWNQTLEQLELSVRLNDGVAEIEKLRGVLGGGEIEAGGQVHVEGARLRDFSFAIRGEQVNVRWPEEFEGSYDANLTLSGDGQQVLLGGDIQILRGLYSKAFAGGGLFGGDSRDYSATDTRALPTNVFFDLDIDAEGNVWVRNDLAKIESSVDLHVGGTPQHPEVTGRIWLLEGGELEYRNVRYRLMGGNLDFVDRERVDPQILVRAETTVDAYQVRLRVEGPLSRIDYQLSSDPALSQQDIIALLAVGRTFQDLSSSGSGAQFTGDLAANYFAGALTGPFERQLQKLIGLDRFEINPLLVAGQADPTTRITVGEEVTDDVFVVFSTEIGANERELYEVEWRTTPKITLTARRDVTGGIGGDLRYSDRFWWKKPQAPVEPAVPSSEAAPVESVVSEGPRVREIRILGVDEEQAQTLRRRIPLEPGAALRRSKVFEGIEALRRFFVENGRILALVDADARPVDGDALQVDLIYEVEPGPVYVVEITGVKKKQARRLRNALEALWAQAQPQQELLRDSADLIRERLREQGYYTVDVQHVTEEADEEFRLTFQVDTGRPVRVGAVNIVGAVEIERDRIARQILTRTSSLFSKRNLRPQVLDEDLAAVKNLYRAEGFLAMRIEEAEIRLSVDGDWADITLTLEEGPRFQISGLTIPDDLPLPSERLWELADLAVGEPFSPGKLLEAEGALRRAFDADGYPDVRVRSQVRVGQESVDIAFLINTGEQKKVAAVEIAGNHVTRASLIRRELDMEQGDLVSREKLLRAQHRLYQLGVFRSVRIDYDEDVAGAGERVVVGVEEAKPLWFSTSLGFDTEAGFTGRFSTSHQNLGGRNVVLGFYGNLSEILRRFQITSRLPHLFNRKLPTLINLAWEQAEKIGFTQERRSLAFRVDRKLGPLWNAFTRYSFQRVDLSDIQDPNQVLFEKTQDLTLGDMGATFYFDTRDNRLVPRSGHYFNVGTRVFTKLLGSEATFTKTQVTYSVDHTFANRTGLFNAWRIGFAVPFGSKVPGQADVPISERFFAGGDSTLRGFGRDRVGPKTPEGVPLGGEGLFLVNTEFRFPIWKSLRWVVFYDVGQVYLFVEDFSLAHLRHVLGTGFRFETPIGPLRLEYGRKLDRQPEETPGELFFAIGWSF